MERDLSDAWTGVTRFILLNEWPPDGDTGSRERLSRKQRNQSSIMSEDYVVSSSLNQMMNNF